MAKEPHSVSPGAVQKRNKRKRTQRHDTELEQLDLLSWNTSLASNNPSSLLVGSNELDGGFFSLEEIDEVDFGLEIPKLERCTVKEESMPCKQSKKQNHIDADASGDDGGDTKFEEESERDKIVLAEKNKRNKKKKATKALKTKGAGTDSLNVEAAKVVDKVNDANEQYIQVKKKVKQTQRNEEFSAVSYDNDDPEEKCLDEDKYYAWNELRLHPVIMKSIYRLGFNKPTPIQKACIPAAAHQGKDVVGAAETGSGKTLAFGLPIFQRLIEEQEKVSKGLEEKGEEAEKFAPRGLLRALIITPTRELALQVTDHLKAFSKDTNVRVVPIVGGMSTEKQSRLLKGKPEIVVGTPGRLWELMSGGEKHLVELHSLSFFVLDEADRMIENGHFRELQSIIDMLPGSAEGNFQNIENCIALSSVQRKKRQTFVFSATISLSVDFRKKLKRGATKAKQSASDGFNSIEALSERAGMRANVAIIDLTNMSILVKKLEESFIDCREEDKDAYLYYILSIHGQGRTIVFCTSIAALRRISSVLRILGINVWTLHAQMQQRARLKALDRFRGNEHGILLATDVAARGLDIPGVRTVVHYQLPHSAEVYIHRSGRTARASADGCSIALISPNEASKFASLCRSFSKESFQRFPFDNSYMPEVMKRLSLAQQIDKILRKDSKAKAKKSWFERSAESIELIVDSDESEEEIVNNYKQKKLSSMNLRKLLQELNVLLSRPLQPKSFSHRYLAGAGVSPLLQLQFEELAKQKLGDIRNSGENKRRKLVVIGQDCVEPLQALRSAGNELVPMDDKEFAQKRRNMQNSRKKKKEEKKHLREQRRKQRKKLRTGQ